VQEYGPFRQWNRQILFRKVHGKRAGDSRPGNLRLLAYNAMTVRVVSLVKLSLKTAGRS